MKDLGSELYEQRLLVFLEEDTFDGFRQVILNPEQFKKISDSIFVASNKDDSLREGFEMGVVNLDSERLIPPSAFDGMNSINEPNL